MIKKKNDSQKGSIIVDWNDDGNENITFSKAIETIIIQQRMKTWLENDWILKRQKITKE